MIWRHTSSLVRHFNMSFSQLIVPCHSSVSCVTIIECRVILLNPLHPNLLKVQIVLMPTCLGPVCSEPAVCKMRQWGNRTAGINLRCLSRLPGVTATCCINASWCLQNKQQIQNMLILFVFFVFLSEDNDPELPTLPQNYGTIHVYNLNFVCTTFLMSWNLHNTLNSYIIFPSYTISEYENLSRNYHNTVCML